MGTTTTIAITGSAGGIGRATRARLEAAGARVIGVDVRDAEVLADLSTPAGRAAMVEGVTAACDGALDGLVAAAGITGDDGRQVTAINYFGAIATLDGLRPLLAGRPGASAVAVSSNSTTTQPGVPVALAEACLAGDETAALDGAGHGIGAYAASKLALARWVRRRSVTDEWIGAGIRLNAVAPGLIRTPMTADSEEMILGLGDIFPVPIGRAGRAEEVAGLLAYLLSEDAGFFVGSVITMDGGTDATLRSEHWPVALPG
jgi:NAD(P)-dependent dehydrogenase (short-subunit alcohol dehydrogenase family)